MQSVTAATSCTRHVFRAARPSPAHVRAARAVPARAVSREAELEAMAEFKKGLSAKLEEAQPTEAAAAVEAAVATEAPAKVLREVTTDDFYEVIQSHGDKLTVVDCYTEWCGPCKMILPTLVQWSEELEGQVQIIKFNCNKANKELGQKLGIKVAPTFLLYKNNEQVGFMTGAKTEQLRTLIEQNM